MELAPQTVSKVIFQSSGSEANDTAVKLVHYYNNSIGRPDAEAIDRAVSQGFNLIALGMDTVFLADGARRALAALHSA